MYGVALDPRFPHRCGSRATKPMPHPRPAGRKLPLHGPCRLVPPNPLRREDRTLLDPGDLEIHDGNRPLDHLLDLVEPELEHVSIKSSMLAIGADCPIRSTAAGTRSSEWRDHPRVGESTSAPTEETER